LVKEENEMIDFELTEEQLMLQRVCHDFAENEIRPRAWELEKNTDPGKCYDFDLVKKASQLGLRTTTIPEELGGSGLDLKTIVIMWEELAWGDMGFAFSLYHTIFFGRGVSHMPESLREELLPPFLKDDTFLLAYALSEPQGMTEVVLPYDGPDGGFKIFAEKQGDEYVVSGTKQYCSNAINAKIIVLNARTKKNAPLRESWSSFFMPVDTPGLTIGKPHDHMGARLLPTSELFLEDVRIPARYLIGGEENKGFEQNLVHDPVVLLLKNTIVLGTSWALYEESVRYARERVVCGNPIITYPTIKVMLSDMRGKLEAARAMIWKCAWEIDRDPLNTKYNNEMGYLVKAFMNEWMANFLRNADEIHGGMGTNREMLSEKLIRDLFTLLHGLTNRSIAYLKSAPTLEV